MSTRSIVKEIEFNVIRTDHNVPNARPANEKGRYEHELLAIGGVDQLDVNKSKIVEPIRSLQGTFNHNVIFELYCDSFPFEGAEQLEENHPKSATEQTISNSSLCQVDLYSDFL